MAKAMTLIRRCLLLIVIVVTCDPALAQMPSTEMGFESELIQLPSKELPSLSRQDFKTLSFLESKFKVPRRLALEILDASKRLSDPVFPSQADILALIEIESSFNPTAKYIDCYGLMMVQKKSHMKKIRKGESLMDVNVNIRIGVEIAKEYYEILDNNPKATILAINSGVGNYLRKRYNLKYYSKYKAAKVHYE